MTRSASVRVSDIVNDPPYAVARKCASLGWRVLPLIPGTKKPALPGWTKKATTDVETIIDWWSWTYINYDVGIATGQQSGIWVLDLDVKNGVDGSDSLAELAAGRELPETFTVRSSSGRGLHLYWAWPDDVGDDQLRSVHGVLARCVDVKGAGGQVKAPHKATDIIDNRWPVPAPDWLTDAAVDASEKKKNDSTSDVPPVGWSGASSAIQDAVMTVARADSGTRNDTLNKMAFLLGCWSVKLGITEHQAWIACEAGCRTNGLWAEEPEQCRTTFMSGWNAGVNDPKNE